MQRTSMPYYYSTALQGEEPPPPGHDEFQKTHGEPIKENPEQKP